MARKFFPIVVLALVFAVFYTPDNFDPESIRGKRVLITGASSGIGEELAYHYSRLGATVFVTARRGDLLKRVVDKCRKLGAERVEYFVVDMTVAKDRELLVRDVEERLAAMTGGSLTAGSHPHLDHLIINHAVFVPGPFIGSQQNMTSLERDLNVNFVSYVDIASKCLKMLSASADGGHLGVVSSAAGKIGAPRMSSYAADKFALHGFFGSWRQELRSAYSTPVSITLCVLGYIKTETATKAMESDFQKVLALTPSPPSAEDTALAIIKGVTRGAYEIYYPKYVSFLVAIHELIPGYMDDYFGSYLL